VRADGVNGPRLYGLGGICRHRYILGVDQLNPKPIRKWSQVMRLHVHALAAVIAGILLVPGSLPAMAQNQPKFAMESAAITTVLNKQADDWNRGDLEAFATGYKNSPDILFVGKTNRRGYEQMLAGYRKSFPNRDAMGTLTFSNLEVQPLDEHFATVTGRFHLERTAAGGGDLGGHYLLVMEKTAAGWKIIRDATTDEPTPAH
jgi:uncharacterized protein (TIGR02246 family)